MAKVGKEIIRVTDKDDRNYYLEVPIIINVGADGIFSATLEKSDIDLIKSYGVNLRSYSRTGTKSGFFRNDTKEKLIIEAKQTLLKCISKELISNEKVLKYSFATACSFGFTMDGKIVPNMGWHSDGKLDNALYWQSGTVFTASANPSPTMVQMYIKPYSKKTYKYAGGEVKVFYEVLTAFDNIEVTKDNYYLAWLAGICSTTPPAQGSVKEIEYTEDRAKFFVEMYKSMCKLAYSVAKFSEPEAILKLIETGKYLM